MEKKFSKSVSLIAFLILCFAVELAGGWFTQTSVGSWYPGLIKAGWNPPGWVFGPVWTLLYITIAISGWLIYCHPNRKSVLPIYFLQLFFNFLWSFVFFYLRSPLLGLLDISVLLITIVFTIYAFWRVYRPAALFAVFLFNLDNVRIYSECGHMAPESLIKIIPKSDDPYFVDTL